MSQELLTPIWDPSTLRAAPVPTGARKPGYGNAAGGGRQIALLPRAGLHESWQIVLSDPVRQRSLWLRFGILTSSNGFKRLAESWALFFQDSGTGGGDSQKHVVRQAYDIRSFTVPSPGAIQIGESRWTETATQGVIQGKGQSIRWDLTMEPRARISRESLPSLLTRTPLGRYRLATVGGDLIFRGTVQAGGETYEIDGAPGMQGHYYGPHLGRNWVWAHANHFVDERDVAVPAFFEGFAGRARLPGGASSPQLVSLLIGYRGRNHAFHSLRDPFRIRSRAERNEWVFQADRGDLSFRGKARAEYRDFVGLTLEDTDGSLVHCADTKLADLELQVYRRGKLESSLRSARVAAMEIATPARNPYVPTVI